MCILTCSDPARRIREVRSPDRNSAVSNRPRSNAPRKHRLQIRGRTCRDQNSRADTGIPADRPDCTARPANRPCSNTCRRHKRRGRCSSDRNSRLEFKRERIKRAMRSSFSTVRCDSESPRKSIKFSFESARPPSPAHPFSYQPFPVLCLLVTLGRRWLRPWRGRMDQLFKLWHRNNCIIPADPTCPGEIMKLNSRASSARRPCVRAALYVYTRDARDEGNS